MILAVPSVIAGFFGEVHFGLAMIAGIVAAVAGFALARTFYRETKTDPLPSRIGRAAEWCRDRFYFDEAYEALNKYTQELLAKVTDWLDRWIIAGLGVKGTAGVTHITGSLLRLLQTGNLQTYALLFVLGVLVLLYLTLT
jgi:NADH-quinone oxidoreductase subunit L